MGRVVLSTGLAGMSGTIGGLQLEQRAGGTVAKARATTPPRRTKAMKDGERRVERLAVAWNALDTESFEAWKAFAWDSAVRNNLTGAHVVPNPYNLFCRYAGRVRQVDPAAPLVGFRPPEGPFGGDGVGVTVSPSSGPLPLPPLQNEPFGEGVLRFRLDAANSPGVVTELMTQPLVNARRRVYGDRYVSRGFWAFEGAAEVEIPCEVGAWACGYRFVRAATGQATAIFALGVVEVRG